MEDGAAEATFRGDTEEDMGKDRETSGQRPGGGGAEASGQVI